MAKRGARKRQARLPVNYGQLDRDEPSVGNPIDLAVHRRVGRRPLLRQLVRTSQAVVDALGKRRKVWFAYEDALSRLTDMRQAAYFNMGVEHGVAAARAQELEAGRAVQKVAARLMREALATDLPQEGRTAAAVLAAWGLLASPSLSQSRVTVTPRRATRHPRQPSW